MRFALLGATGATGSCFLRQALEQKHEVVALVRSPEKITIQHENLRIVKCNIYDADDLKSNFSDVDSVISCLGGKGTETNALIVKKYYFRIWQK